MEQKHLLALILVIVIIGIAAYVYTDKEAATIDVRGTGVIEGEPDTLKVYFNLEYKADTASEAEKGLNKIADDVEDALYLAGIPREDITTQGFSVQPNYNWDYSYPRNREQEGYIARQTLVVETEQYDMADRIIDLGVENGALVSYINFELSQDKQNEYKAEAMKKASEDARNKAEAVAEGLDKRVGKVVSVSVDEFYYPPYRLYTNEYSTAIEDVEMVRSQAKQAVSDIRPDNIDISASVTVRFKIY